MKITYPLAVSDRLFVDGFILGIAAGILLSWLVVWLVVFKAPRIYRYAITRLGINKGRRAKK